MNRIQDGLQLNSPGNQEAISQMLSRPAMFPRRQPAQTQFRDMAKRTLAYLAHRANQLVAKVYP